MPTLKGPLKNYFAEELCGVCWKDELKRVVHANCNHAFYCTKCFLEQDFETRRKCPKCSKMNTIFYILDYKGYEEAAK